MTALDDAYANAAHIPGAETFPPAWEKAAAAFRNARDGRVQLDQSYGAHPRQRFDLFLPDGVASGLLVFVHGGYWKAFGRRDWSHLAKGAVTRDWAVAMPSYVLCPDARISDITQQIAAAVTELADEVTGPIILAGHSAGGHLVARMLAPGMLPLDILGRIRHVMPISPVADLRPLLRTGMNEILRLDEAEAAAESPVLQPVPQTPVTVWVGANERPAFLDQARWLAEAWGAGHVVAAGKHHFDVIDPLTDPNSDMLERLLT